MRRVRDRLGAVVIEAREVTVRLDGAIDASRGDCLGVAGATMNVAGMGMRVVVATRPVDFRKGHDGLAAVVEHELGLDPYSGVAVVFRPRGVPAIGSIGRTRECTRSHARMLNASREPDPKYGPTRIASNDSDAHGCAHLILDPFPRRLLLSASTSRNTARYVAAGSVAPFTRGLTVPWDTSSIRAVTAGRTEWRLTECAAGRLSVSGASGPPFYR